MSDGVRLQKFLAERGVASRRKCEQMILDGRVAVNGAVVTTLGAKVFDGDFLTLDGEPVVELTKRVYVMVNKPVGVVTTAKDQFGRPNAVDLVPRSELPPGTRLFPVGRLDYHTSGLLLLTNDGDFAQRTAHPSHETEKTYIALLEREPDERALAALRTGVEIDGRATKPAIVNALGGRAIEITIHEGRNRQVRKMCAAVGCGVVELERVAVGGLGLGDLGRGEWRFLTDAEILTLTGGC